MDPGAVRQDKGYERRVHLVGYGREKKLMRYECAAFGYIFGLFGKKGQYRTVTSGDFIKGGDYNSAFPIVLL